MKSVILYTDGSSLGNPGASGYCALLEYKAPNGRVFHTQVSGGEAYSTNGRMELKAVVEGLKMLTEPCRVVIVSDSKYVCDSIEQYLPNWQKKGFKDVKHTDLWGEYIHVGAKHTITTQWVKAHNGHPQNEHCDKVARENANLYAE
ncbi:MAG: ribonuclease HI [Helicobacter sp.]|uniref:ribonuclease H n=1 Tax=Helicobacter bilis TaxID=37372 RepID=A0A1Q2LHV9_9HELI|nr:MULTISPECIES: ribonuclease HI [Helicobacter]AQQ60060.1 ribonuclease H [Helicobacter bilis]MDY5822859.1 ribonuclease HI [Helicobacter sp.]